MPKKIVRLIRAVRSADCGDSVTNKDGRRYDSKTTDKSALQVIELDPLLRCFYNRNDRYKHFRKYPSYEKTSFKFYGKNDFNAPFASGSAQYNVMIVCPCSMGTLGRIAAGISDDLITRAADVILKERRKLILVTRETPLSLIHINNIKTINIYLRKTILSYKD